MRGIGTPHVAGGPHLPTQASLSLEAQVATVPCLFGAQLRRRSPGPTRQRPHRPGSSPAEGWAPACSWRQASSEVWKATMEVLRPPLGSVRFTLFRACPSVQSEMRVPSVPLCSLS